MVTPKYGNNESSSLKPVSFSIEGELMTNHVKLKTGVKAEDFLARGLPALADAALRAFPGAVERGCRDIEMHTNRDDKRVSGMASNGPGR
jgi:hypothetical protein